MKRRKKTENTKKRINPFLSRPRYLPWNAWVIENSYTAVKAKWYGCGERKRIKGTEQVRSLFSFSWFTFEPPPFERKRRSHSLGGLLPVRPPIGCGRSAKRLGTNWLTRPAVGVVHVFAAVQRKEESRRSTWYWYREATRHATQIGSTCTCVCSLICLPVCAMIAPQLE